MNKRSQKNYIYQSQLKEAITNVESTINLINKLKNSIEIDVKVIEDDLLSAYLNLELSLAIMAILLRKMRENNYLVMDDDVREVINAIIHSNRFDYQNKEVVWVYSHHGRETINIDRLLTYARQFI